MSDAFAAALDADYYPNFLLVTSLMALLYSQLLGVGLFDAVLWLLSQPRIFLLHVLGLFFISIWLKVRLAFWALLILGVVSSIASWQAY